MRGQRKDVPQSGEASTPGVCEVRVGESSSHILACSNLICWVRTMCELRARESTSLGEPSMG